VKACWIVGVASVLVLAGCGGGPQGVLCDGGPCPTEVVRNVSFRSTAAPKLDLLFVIDPTPAIAPVAGNLASSLPTFATVLQEVKGPSGVPELQDNHIALIPATVPSNGCNPPPVRNEICGVDQPDQYLSTQLCGTVTNYSGSLQDMFSCMGSFGNNGCGSLQPFEAMRRALSGDSTNGGLVGATPFLRPDAWLYVVIIAGADDASAANGGLAPVDDYVTFLQGLKSDPNMVGGAIIGPPTDCTTTSTFQQLAPRLAAFNTAFGYNGLLQAACDQDYGPALTLVAQTLVDLLKPPCLTGVLDTDPTTPGLQADCVVDWRVTQLDGTTQDTVLPSCDESAPPCSVLTPDTATCGPGGSRLSIDVTSSWCDELAVTTTVSCLGCADPADPACATP
jgi:hypothetical protein